MGVQVEVVVAAAATGSAPYTQDFTSTELGTLQPKAALFFACYATSLNTITAGMMHMAGFTDGVADHEQTFSSEDNVATSDAYQNDDTNRCIELIDPADGSEDGYATFDSWQNGAVRVEWQTVPSRLCYIIAVLFAGTDVSADVQQVNPHGTVNNAITVTAPYSTETHLVFSFHGRRGGSFGIVSNDETTVKQGWGFFDERDNQGTTVLASLFRNDYGNGTVLWNGANEANYEFGNFQTNGDFDITSRTGVFAANDEFSVLMISLGASGLGVDLQFTTTPASTGEQTIGVGFTAQFALALGGMAAAWNTAETDVDAGSLWIAAMTDDDQVSMAWSAEDNVGTTNTNSFVNTATPAYIFDGNGTLEGDADKPTGGMFQTNDVVLDWQTVPGTQRVFMILAIEAEAGGSTYEDALTLARTHDETMGPDMELDEDMTLARTLAVSQAADMTWGTMFSLARVMTISQAADVTWGGVLSLARTLGDTLSADVTWGTELSLVKVLDASNAADVTWEGAISLAKIVATAQSGGLDFEDSLTLARSLGLSQVSSITKEEAITFARSMGITDTVTLDAVGDVTLAQTKGFSPSTTVDFGVGISLGKGMAITLASDLTLEEALALARVLSVASSSALAADAFDFIILLNGEYELTKTGAGSYEHVRSLLGEYLDKALTGEYDIDPDLLGDYDYTKDLDGDL